VYQSPHGPSTFGERDFSPEIPACHPVEVFLAAEWSLGPVFERESRDAPEVADIAGDQDTLTIQHDRGDPEVHPADVEFQSDKLMSVSSTNRLMTSLHPHRLVGGIPG
jgi:hypothetical protein